MDKQGKGLSEDQQWGGEEPTTTGQTCLICGCTDEKACEGGCSWLLPGVCSKCVTVTTPECVEALVGIIEELHKDEIKLAPMPHTGKNCPTCDTVSAANLIATALKR